MLVLGKKLERCTFLEFKTHLKFLTEKCAKCASYVRSNTSDIFNMLFRHLRTHANNLEVILKDVLSRVRRQTADSRFP
jgi:hypothetical protein